MNLRELIKLFRSDVDDETQPFMWSNADAVEYANDAQNEAARRARLFVDSSTTAICRATITGGSPLVALDSRVLFVRKARIAGQVPLRRMNMQDMEAHDPFWQDAMPGRPVAFIPDSDTGFLRLHPTPDDSDILLMTVVRMPLADMVVDGDEPEVKLHYQRSLRFWMAYRAYAKQDAESNDPKKSADSLALFEQEFGGKSSAIDEEWISREQTEGDGTF